jgi:hypothetical protein
MSERSNDSDSAPGTGQARAPSFLAYWRGADVSAVCPRARRSVIYQAGSGALAFDRAYRLGNKHHVTCDWLYSQQMVLEE